MSVPCASLLVAVVALAIAVDCYAQTASDCPVVPAAAPVFPQRRCKEARRRFTFRNDASNTGPLVVARMRRSRSLTRRYTIAPGKGRGWKKSCGGMQFYLEAKECGKCFEIYVVPFGSENKVYNVIIPPGVCNPPTGDTRPDIVVMLVDDIGAQDFEFNGASFMTMPNLNDLVTKSFHFIAGWATPLCLTTRAQIMTGKLPYVTNWFSHKTKPPLGERNYGTTIGNLAQEAGYKTFFAGKWQIPGRARGFGGYGFDEYLTIRHADNRSEESIYADFDGPFAREEDGRLVQDQNRYGHPLIVRNDVVLDTDPLNFSSNMIVEDIHRFMRQTRDAGEKSFIWWPSPLAHKDYDQETGIPRTWAKMPILNSDGVVIGYDQSEASFVKMVNYMDTVVGLFIEGLKKYDLYSNTLFVFTSDNGSPGIPERPRPYKAAVFDERGVLVPVLFHHGGGMIPPKETQALISQVDFYATLAAFMEQPIDPPRNNSYDFSKFIKGETTEEPRKWVFSFQDDNRMIRTKEYYMNAAQVIFECAPSPDIANCTRVNDVAGKPEVLAERVKMLRVLEELETTGYSDATVL